MEKKGRLYSRRDLLNILVFGGGGLALFGAAFPIASESDQAREQVRFRLQEELNSYKYEVRVWRGGVVSGSASLIPPVVEPARLVVEVDTFLTKDKPTTEVDSQGVVHMSLGNAVLRYDPRIVKNPSFPYEFLPSYEIVNPQNVGIVLRFPQK